MAEENSSNQITTSGKNSTSKSSIPKLLIFCAIIFIAAMTFLMLWGGRDELRKVKPGYAGPDFTLKDLNFKEVSLADYKGKVVLLNIWSMTCPPCVDEVPYFENLYQAMKDEKDFHLLTVNSNRGETHEDVSKFMKKMGLNFQALIDTKKTVYKRYKLTGWPETFLIDRNGIIVEKFIGPNRWDSPLFIQKISNLINKPI